MYNLQLKDGKLVFKATNYIGLIPINERISIDIRPKVPIHNLTRLLSKSGVAPATFERLTNRYSVSDEEPVPQLMDIFTHGLLTACEPIRQNGIFREYYKREEETSFPRGKIVFHSTIQRHASRNVSHRVTSSWFDRKVDNGPNRLLKYTIWHLSQQYRRLTVSTKDATSRKGAAKILHRLNETYGLFDDVEIDHEQQFLHHRLVRDPSLLPSIRDYYRDAVNLAVAIVTNRSVSLEKRDDAILALPTLLVNMEDIFERYARNVMINGLLDDTTFAVLDGNLSPPKGAAKRMLDGPGATDTTPDIVIREATGPAPTTLVVVEVKYKRFKVMPERPDFNQLIGYSATYRCDCNILLHPAMDHAYSGLAYLGQIDSRHYYSYAMDLDLLDLAAEEARLVAALRGLVAKHS